MKTKWIVLIIVCLIFLIGLLTIGSIMSRVEHPKYDVTSSINEIEVRKYNPMIIASVEVQGKREEAIKEGFKILANYIFGNNTSQQNLEMTAPVEQGSGEKIAMTAPVQQQSSRTTWTISFVMPSKYTMATLPKPNDDRVKLSEVPEKQFIVLRFSGKNTDKNIEKHHNRLLQHIKEKQIKVVGLPKYAFYNPPWTLPFMRRNEILFEIDLNN